MSVEQMCAAIGETGYLDLFDRRHYDAAFREYKERFGPLYTEAARAAGEAGIAALAASLMDELERSWSRQRFWNRSAFQASEKQMLVTYVSPMLLGLEEPLCRELARALRDEWRVRRPRDAYHIASYEKLAKGFRNTILGIDVSGFVGGRERQAQDEEEDF